MPVEVLSTIGMAVRLFKRTELVELSVFSKYETVFSKRKQLNFVKQRNHFALFLLHRTFYCKFAITRKNVAFL